MSRVTAPAAHPGFVGAICYREVEVFAEDAIAGSGAATVVLDMLPANSRLLRGAAEVTEAFNAGTTNVIIVGDADDDDEFIAAGDLNEAATGVTAFAAGVPVRYAAEKEIRVKYSYTGTAPTTGRVRVWIEYVRLAA